MSSGRRAAPEAVERTGLPEGTGFLDRVETALTDRLETRAREAGSPRLGLLWRRIAGAASGGKRTRPMLLGIGHSAFGGDEIERLVQLGCAFELLHTGLLIHDDMIDRDFARRGRPTISAQYRDDASSHVASGPMSEHIGGSVAVIAGDLLLSEAIRVVHLNCAETAAGSAIAEVFHGAVESAASGELDDVVFSAGIATATFDDVLRMHRSKTASYSFEAPLLAGALLAGAHRDLAQRIAEVGRLLGIGYQIIDDVLGTFGTPSVTGKPNETDLRERKSTILIGLVEQDRRGAEVVRRWRAGEVGSGAVRELLRDLQVDRRARSLAAEHCRRAHDELASLPVEAGARRALEALIGDVLDRTA